LASYVGLFVVLAAVVIVVVVAVAKNQNVKYLVLFLLMCSMLWLLLSAFMV
jgi:hypothetical protein